MAPEVLRSKAYAQAEDICSFGMIMYFTATGKQPFVNCAHDHHLTLKICNGTKPEINVPEAPKCYIDLMKRCWDSNLENRSNAIEMHELMESFYDYYNSCKKVETSAIEIRKPFKEAEIHRKTYRTSLLLRKEVNIQKLFTQLGYLILLQRIFQNLIF
ncbi:hypothetical protein RclHR1_10230009 [Rhizophagus clarus]|uniref:Protein kinase domain-containing protein n=1 Tax=Rhizophagus clarus TaxID=94130 RepID=A0A2Z6QCW8_9GLOM|nr:hypothetical protein RclHR1_10230009 [Rhizophagus clarus]